MERHELAGKTVLDAAFAVHSELGPGLLESAYEACLVHEIGKRGAMVRRQIPLAIRYKGIELEAGYRLDLVVDECVLVELKAVERLSDLHMSQILTYLKLSDMSLGYLLNFNVQHMKQGIKRVVYRLN
jgi:GxxExxY protein